LTVPSAHHHFGEGHLCHIGNSQLRSGDERHADGKLDVLDHVVSDWWRALWRALLIGLTSVVNIHVRSYRVNT